MMMKKGFTLVELLIVIAILAILAVVVIFVINPFQLLAQSRDANRVSDLASLNSALTLYNDDQSGASNFSLGTSTYVYVSIPDAASSTCGDLGLPALPSGYSYACASTSSLRNVSSTGWIPVNFNNINGGSPFPNLPVDPVNQTSSGFYYTYYASSSQFEVTAIPESAKQRAAVQASPSVPKYPGIMANGSNIGISPLWNVSGLVGYWPFTEGNGSTAYDESGVGNNLTLGGMGTYLSWVPGKVGAAAIQYSGIATNCISQNAGAYNTAPTGALTSAPQTGTTISFWANLTTVSTVFHLSTQYGGSGCDNSGLGGCGKLAGSLSSVNITFPAMANKGWVLYTYVMDPVGLAQYNYLNGVLVNSSTIPSQSYGNITGVYLGIYFNSCEDASAGSYDDFRIYNRALSSAEIMALYNAEK